MDQNIFELAKKLSALSPREYGAALIRIREHGYKPGERTSVIIDLARALTSVWDGKAPTLDQASAWREVWKYLGDAGLLPASGHSQVQQALFAIGDLRSKVNGADPITLKTVISIDTSSFSEADRERLKAAIRSNNPMQVLHTGCVSQEQGEHIAEKYRKAHPEIAALWPTPSSEYSPYNAKPCHPSHELYKTGDADAPEQIKDRNGEVVLDQCRYCRRAESELLDGEPCAKAPARVEVIGKASIAIDGVHLTTGDSKWEGREFGRGCHVSPTCGSDLRMVVIDVKDIPGGYVKYLCEWNSEAGLHSEWFNSWHLSLSKEPSNDNAPLENTRASENLGDVSYETSLALEKLATVVEPARLDVVRRLLVLQDTCYGLANNAGWWTDLETGEDVRNWPKKHLDNWVSAKLMLIVTEVAEAMEGHRKGLKDDKLPHRGMLEVELADAVIRIMDLAGGLNMDVAGAIVEKLAYNMSREDHRIENRKAAGGKSV